MNARKITEYMHDRTEAFKNPKPKAGGSESSSCHVPDQPQWERVRHGSNSRHQCGVYVCVDGWCSAVAEKVPQIRAKLPLRLYARVMIYFSLYPLAVLRIRTYSLFLEIKERYARLEVISGGTWIESQHSTVAGVESWRQPPPLSTNISSNWGEPRRMNGLCSDWRLSLIGFVYQDRTRGHVSCWEGWTKVQRQLQAKQIDILLTSSSRSARDRLS